MRLSRTALVSAVLVAALVALLGSAGLCFETYMDFEDGKLPDQHGWETIGSPNWAIVPDPATPPRFLGNHALSCSGWSAQGGLIDFLDNSTGKTADPADSWIYSVWVYEMDPDVVLLLQCDFPPPDDINVESNISGVDERWTELRMERRRGSNVVTGGKPGPSDHYFDPSNFYASFHFGNTGHSSTFYVDDVHFKTNTLPELAWPGTSGYATDGVEPDAGPPDAEFTYKVVYRDADGHEPSGGVVRLCMQRWDCETRRWRTHKVLRMAAGAGDAASGREYSKSVKLPVGVYRYRFRANDSWDWSEPATGPPTQWTRGPVISGPPHLHYRWPDRGVDPPSGPPGQRFQFGVVLCDPDGDDPYSVKVVVEKIGCDGQWQDHRDEYLNHLGGNTKFGRTYARRIRLNNGVYRYRFEAEDHDGLATGPPTEWKLGPTVAGGRPILVYSGTPGFESDCVDPNTGLPGRYTFRVGYIDSEADAPTIARLRLRRFDGQPPDNYMWEVKLTPDATGNWRTGRDLSCEVEITEHGQYFYQFHVENKDGRARSCSPAKWWNRGPKVTKNRGGSGLSGGGLVTGLSAMPTGQGVELRFSLASAGRVTAVVRNCAGRRVQTICSDVAYDGGSNVLLWNATSNGGLAVPGGLYLVELVARGDDGGETRALAPVRLRR